MAHASVKDPQHTIEIPVCELEAYLADGYELVTKMHQGTRARSSVKPSDVQWNRARTHLTVRTAPVRKDENAHPNGHLIADLVFDRCGFVRVC